MLCQHCNLKLTDEMIDTGYCFECGNPIALVPNKKDQEVNSKQLTIHQENELKELIDSFKMTSGFNFEGYTITHYIKVISAETVLGTGFLSEFSASFSDFFGIENERFSNKLEMARESSTQKLIKKAIQLNANALIGIDFDYVNFSGNIIGVIANGTSVTIKKHDT